jgi:hypothetical protein
MATTETLESTPTGFENCLSCGAMMAEDQRYCLNCGVRRGQTRLPFPDVIAASQRAAATSPAGAPPGGPNPPTAGGAAYGGGSGGNALPITWPVAAAGAAILVLALGVGVLIGHGTAGNGKVAATPQVITVGSGGTTGASSAASSSTTFTSDWPDGKGGWTIQLQSLSKDSTTPAQVAAAKSAASSKGAQNVGALDSDSFSSLNSNLYVIYSGDYKSKKDAQAALGGLKKNFPSATVVQVDNGGGSSSSGSSGSSGKSAKGSTSKQALQNLNSLTPQQYQKQSSKLPDKITTPGKQAPIDKSKAPGGGSGSQTIQ